MRQSLPGFAGCLDYRLTNAVRRNFLVLVQVMLAMYGAWIEGSTQEDIEAIKRSMEAGPTAAEIHGAEAPKLPEKPHPGATKVPPTGSYGRLSWRKIKKNMAERTGLEPATPGATGGCERQRA